MSKTKLFKKIVKSLSVPTQTFVNMQLTQYKKKNRGRRFSIKEKLLALAIYIKSPKWYNFLRKIFAIPSKRTLKINDQSTINSKVVHELLSETRGEYLKKNTEFKYNAFEINNQKIFPLFDAPRLLKCIRNNLLKKDLRFTQDDKQKTAKWEHLKLLLDLDDGEDELRMCNKLTEAHVLPEKIPKMKVKHAAQVFSQRVSQVLLDFVLDIDNYHIENRKHLLPQECTDTADLLLLFDQLFDSFNGRSYKITHKIYKTCVKNNSEHFTLWNKILPVLCSMAFKTEAKKGWYYDMKDFWQYLTFKSNQIPVENFFSSVRSHGVRNINPTFLQFENIYKTLLVNDLCSNHSLGANCEEDTNKMLHNLDVLLMNNPPEPPRNNDDDKIEEICSNDILAGGSDNELVSETKKYEAGYVIKKTKKMICKSCNTCNLDLYDTTPPEVDNYIFSIDITRKSLQYPLQNFTICVNNIIKIIKHFFKNCPHKSGIIRKIKILVRNIVQFDFLSCDIHKEKIEIYVTKFLIKCIIYSWCNNVN
ncbi:hypothetical protein HW555_011314 [Spodoptera exigua]|uniref:Transposase n=1 Tax=Spodoptera exigua TaxID=7107 RepID=A0A835G7Z6_SPOEX|nr:hypothetical protein HW555_011314 [Spodoptera exigua]